MASPATLRETLSKATLVGLLVASESLVWTGRAAAAMAERRCVRPPNAPPVRPWLSAGAVSSSLGVSAAEFADWRAKAGAAGLPLSALIQGAHAAGRAHRQQPRGVPCSHVPIRLGSWTGMRWEIVHPYEWLTCFGGPPSLHGEYSR